jgi:hypothetical protein
MTQRCKAFRSPGLRTKNTGPASVISYSICTVPSSSPVATIGERPFRRSLRNALAFAADIRRNPTVCDENGASGSATTWMVMLARVMAGSSGMTLNVRVMPLPPISIGVCLCRIGDIRGRSPEAGAALGCAGFARGSSTGKSGMNAPGGAPRIGARVIDGFLLSQPFQHGHRIQSDLPIVIAFAPTSPEQSLDPTM